MGCAPTRRAERRLWTLLRGALAVLFIVTLGAGVAAGCSGYDKPQLTPEQLDAGQYDVSCGASPSQGDRCTRDCLEGSCHGTIGRRMCTCGGGVYLQCICMPPVDWPYPTSPTPVAPWCDEITGQPRYLAGERCQREGQQCLSSTSPTQGCTCAPSGTAGVLLWACDSAETLGVPAGSPSCESFGSGERGPLSGEPCDTLYDICVARDYDTGSTTPRGCVCAQRRPLPRPPEWVCGSTNRWFRPG